MLSTSCLLFISNTIYDSCNLNLSVILHFRCTITSKIKSTHKSVFLPISMLNSILAVANLLANNNITIYYVQVNSLRLRSSVASKCASKHHSGYHLFCCWRHNYMLQLAIIASKQGCNREIWVRTNTFYDTTVVFPCLREKQPIPYPLVSFPRIVVPRLQFHVHHWFTGFSSKSRELGRHVSLSSGPSFAAWLLLCTMINSS